MSERVERQLPRSEQSTVTPQPSRQSLFDWIEDKFTGREAMPRYFELKLAGGAGGMHYRPETIHQKEFKPNTKKPERETMVELANKFTSVAQDHCNELGHPQGYAVLAINHIKGAHPYGVYYMKLRSVMGAPGQSFGDSPDGETEIFSDAFHRQNLLQHQLEHTKSSDEHMRFMQDSLQRSTSSVLQMQQEMIRELRIETQSLKSQQLDWWKAIQAAENQTDEREMRRAGHKVKMELLERGAGLVLQMVPVVAKTLERNKTGGQLPAMSETITASPESVAIEQFIRLLDNDQKVALFGHFDEQGAHVPGIFTGSQVKIFADVAELKIPPTALEMLLPGGEYAISMAQIGQAQGKVPMDQLMPLYAMIQEGKKQRIENEASS